MIARKPYRLILITTAVITGVVLANLFLLTLPKKFPAMLTSPPIELATPLLVSVRTTPTPLVFELFISQPRNGKVVGRRVSGVAEVQASAFSTAYTGVYITVRPLDSADSPYVVQYTTVADTTDRGSVYFDVDVGEPGDTGRHFAICVSPSPRDVAPKSGEVLGQLPSGSECITVRRRSRVEEVAYAQTDVAYAQADLLYWQTEVVYKQTEVAALQMKVTQMTVALTTTPDPASTPLRSFDGIWRGTTQQKGRVEMEVEGNAIAKMSIDYDIKGVECEAIGGGAVIGWLSEPPPAPVTGNIFSIINNDIRGSTTITVDGSFDSSTSVSGNFRIVTDCGTIDGKWSATKRASLTGTPIS